MSKKQPIVVDSSVIAKWVNTQREENISQANKILDDAKAQKVELFTSEVAKYEVGNALLVKKGLELTRAYISLGTVYNLPLHFVPETQKLAELTYKTGQDLNITYYDASFLSVAEQLGASLITDNVKHHGKSTRVRVISLKDY